ncbi:hypothetical protein [Nocardia farcinica]|uniref:hypothetical protein n=1 Tax=Nocardia farcinica TaxID=37329 RepID=UPI00245472B6|nr:hypothetical protein [Nocardia farcinica]
MPPAPNSATRLARFLDRLLGVERNMITKQALSQILGVEDDAELARDFGFILALPDQVAEEIERYADPEHDDVDVLLQWEGPVKRALDQCWAFTSPIQGPQSHFSKADIVALQACSPILSRARIEPRIEQETLDSLRQSVNEFYEEVIAATALPPELLSFLLDQLDLIRRALREYAVRGAEALNEALDQSVGALWRHARAGDLGTAAPEAGSPLGRFNRILVQIAAITGVAAGILALPGQAQEAQGVIQEWVSETSTSETLAGEGDQIEGSSTSSN